MSEPSEAEKEAHTQYQAAKRLAGQLKRDIERGTTPRADQLRTLDQLWRHVNDFIPRHWRDEPKG